MNNSEFSLEKALAANGKCQTRQGRAARVICTDRAHPHPLIALVVGPYEYEAIICYGLDGRYHTETTRNHPDDLVNLDDE